MPGGFFSSIRSQTILLLLRAKDQLTNFHSFGANIQVVDRGPLDLLSDIFFLFSLQSELNENFYRQEAVQLGRQLVQQLYERCSFSLT
jgi:hypothetical protein